MSGNDITIVGNVTREPELRYTASGQATATFGLAVNRRWQNRQTNEWEEAVSFFSVVTWRELAENICESVAKGTRVIVTGRLEQRSWDTPDGEKKTVVEIVADEVGPSLKWATASVVRNERQNESQGRGRSSSAPRGGGNGQRQASAPPAGSYDYGDEPFAMCGIDETVPARLARRLLGGAQ